MSEPVPQSPLHAFGLAAQARTIDESCGVWVNEVAMNGYVSLRGAPQNAAFAAAVALATGVALPATPCAFAQANDNTICWLSPDEWMIVCPRAALRQLLGDLNSALTGIRSQVADNSGGYTQIFLQGKNATDVLSHTRVYDLARLTPGRIVGTTFGKSSIYLRRDGTGYRLLLRRSFADYIWRYLIRAATPYGLGIADNASSTRKGGEP
jgi:sarcosine oxidase, subunit gamma